jgi:hypothetical protein
MNRQYGKTLNNTTIKLMEQNKISVVNWLVEQLELIELIENLPKHIYRKKEIIEQAKQKEAEQNKVTEDTSDGYHTFKELYDIRKAYNVALFNEWAKDWHDYDVHKSWRHNDGELCFGGGWFIVSAKLPSGQISNHYKAEDWDLFKIPETEKALFPFDGHTTQDVINRLLTL